MGVHDFRHYQAPNGVIDMQSYPLGVGQTFVAGEPVVIFNTGTVIECADDPSAVDGIAAHGTVDVDGNGLGLGHPISVYGTSSDQIFITKNWATNGDGARATPTQSIIGDLAGFTGPGTWFLDRGATNQLCQVVGVQDAAGNNLGDPNVLPGTGVWVLFRFI